MAIDASIPLQGRPVEPPDTQEIYGRMLSLKHMQAQQQQQQALAPLVYQQQKAAATAAQIQAQQMQQDQKDEEIGGRAYNEAKGDLKQYPALAAKYGMSQRGLAKLNQNMLAHQAAATKQQSADLDVEAKRLKNQEATHAQLSDRYNGLLNLTDEEMERRWPDAVSQMFKDGLHTPQEHAAMLKTYGEFPGRDTVKYLRNQNTSVAQATKNAQLAASQSTNAKNQQAIDEKKKQDVIGQLRGATNLDQWNKILADNGRGMNDFGPPPFDTQTGEGATERTPNPGALKRLNRMGMTPSQAEAADAAELRARELKQREDRQAAHQNELEGRGDSPAADLIRQRRQQVIDAGEQKKWEDIDKAKVAGEKAILAKREKDVDKYLKDSVMSGSRFTSEAQVMEALQNPATDKDSKSDHDAAQKVADGIKEINRKHAAQLQGVQDRYANSIRARKGKAVDYDVDPDTLTYKERAVKGGAKEPDDADEPTPPATPKPTKATSTTAANATPQRMKNAAGHVIEYDPKLNKWVDAQTRKPVQ